ncbi:MAG: methyl-accepting chemotaxis protein [Deltaproteobacteria bacterium]
MIVDRIEFLNKQSIRKKVSFSVAVIFALVIFILTSYSIYREKSRIMEQVLGQADDMTTMYFDSLNTMMLTGTMDQRHIIAQKMLAREGVVEARAIRGKPVSEQYGQGLTEDAARDDLDLQALNGEHVSEIAEKNGKRILTIITPFRATENTRGVNCLQCHDVKSGSVNGAVRISYSLDKMDALIRYEFWMSIGGSIAFFAAGLILINLLLKAWVINPLNKLMDVVSKRAKGDLAVRVKDITSDDELGNLAHSFNEMSDIMDEAAAKENQRILREHAAAEELRAKVDDLLKVITKVAAGDYTAQVSFSGKDSIGELAGQLQKMIGYIRESSEEKVRAMGSLQQRVDIILNLVTRAADGDLTGQIRIEGNDALVRLGLGVQQMIDSLNALVTQVQRSGIQLASSATSIAATSKQQEATVAEQAATTNEIVTTATEISATSKELVSTMNEVSKVADVTGEAAENGRMGLKKMESTMHNIVDAAGSISSKFGVLNEKASNISTVVTTIAKVADQTNLLSLNAAIEAEKAGEYGFGFSVVAKEIRRLADQTAVATLDIEQMVKEMQSAVSAGVMSMERFSEQVRHSVNDVSEVSVQLSQIIEQVQALTPRFETVHQGMQFQSEGASHIKTSMIQLNEAAQQTVESLKESNEAISQLNVAAHNLQGGVIKFKVRNDA